jgi:transposase
MKEFALSVEEKIQLEVKHYKSRDGKERDRLKAILLRSESWTIAMISQALNIKLHFLPPYSPNLNPIERLWKVMNEHARNNRFFKGAKDFKEAINCFFDETLPEIGSTLNERINDNFQLLKT